MDAQSKRKLEKNGRKPFRLKVRSVVQMAFFALIAMITVNKALEESGLALPYVSSASLHALCPFGGVVSIYTFVTAGAFVQKIHESSFILMLAAFLLAVLFGPVFCGWVCPLGSVQEWMGKLGRRWFGRRYNRFIPAKVDFYLRYTRYMVLAMVIYKTAYTGKLMFQDIDPYYALFQFWNDEVTPAALIILGATMLLSLFVERPWCKYACPYGAILGLFNLFRVFQIRRNPATCLSCKKCDNACPMNISVSSGTTVSNHQCISCLSCTSEHACPAAETVSLSTKGGSAA